MSATRQMANLLDATRPTWPGVLSCRAVQPDHHLHSILDRSSATWSPEEAAYVAAIEARAGEMENRDV